MASPKCAVCQHRFALFYRPPDGSEPFGAWPRCRTCTMLHGQTPIEVHTSDDDGGWMDISEAEIEARYTAALAQIKARNRAARLQVSASSLC